MSKFFYLAAALIYTAGCSSSSNVAADAKTVEANSVINKSVAAVNQPNSNVEISINVNKIIIQNMAVTKDNVRNWNAKNTGSKKNTPIAGNIGEMTTAAPDNSEISSRMNDKGEPVETRVFKNHPVLTKVERTDLDNRNIKVYLKNGKVFNLPEGKADNFLTASADEILIAVGRN